MSDVSDNSMVVFRRRGGRPRVPEPRSTLSTWIWAKQHDQLVQMAKEQEKSVSALVRGILAQAVEQRDKRR